MRELKWCTPTSKISICHISSHYISNARVETYIKTTNGSIPFVVCFVHIWNLEHHGQDHEAGASARRKIFMTRRTLLIQGAWLRCVMMILKWFARYAGCTSMMVPRRFRTRSRDRLHMSIAPDTCTTNSSHAKSAVRNSSRHWTTLTIRTARHASKCIWIGDSCLACYPNTIRSGWCDIHHWRKLKENLCRSRIYKSAWVETMMPTASTANCCIWIGRTIAHKGWCRWHHPVITTCEQSHHRIA